MYCSQFFDMHSPLLLNNKIFPQAIIISDNNQEMSLCTEEKCLPATENGFAFGSEDTTVDSAFLICRELEKGNPELLLKLHPLSWTEGAVCTTEYYLETPKSDQRS